MTSANQKVVSLPPYSTLLQFSNHQSFFSKPFHALGSSRVSPTMNSKCCATRQSCLDYFCSTSIPICIGLELATETRKPPWGSLTSAQNYPAVSKVRSPNFAHVRRTMFCVPIALFRVNRTTVACVVDHFATIII